VTLQAPIGHDGLLLLAGFSRLESRGFYRRAASQHRRSEGSNVLLIAHRPIWWRGRRA